MKTIDTKIIRWQEEMADCIMKSQSFVLITQDSGLAMGLNQENISLGTFLTLFRGSSAVQPSRGLCNSLLMQFTNLPQNTLVKEVDFKDLCCNLMLIGETKAFGLIKHLQHLPYNISIDTTADVSEAEVKTTAGCTEKHIRILFKSFSDTICERSRAVNNEGNDSHETSEIPPPVHVKLLQPYEMFQVGRFDVPRDFYCVTQNPAPLAGMIFPSTDSVPWNDFKKLGFGHIVCLASDHPDYDPSPLNLACAVNVEVVSFQSEPRNPERDELLIKKASIITAQHLLNREGVIVHCEGGKERTGTVVGCVLRILGVSALEVLAYLDMVNKTRGHHGWPESRWHAQLIERMNPDSWMP